MRIPVSVQVFCLLSEFGEAVEKCPSIIRNLMRHVNLHEVVDHLDKTYHIPGAQAAKNILTLLNSRFGIISFRSIPIHFVSAMNPRVKF